MDNNNTQDEEDKKKAQEEKKRKALARMNISTLNQCVAQAQKKLLEEKDKSQDMADENVYKAHANTLMWVANNIVLAHQRRKFVVDDNNSSVLRFLLYYFNGSPLAEEVFPGRGYKLHKHILLHGTAGTGKTLLMQIFSEYLRITENPRFFYNLSVTQMVNYYTLHNNLDRYTFNEEENKGFKCMPVNICLNDIGVQSTKFYGTDTELLTNEFLHARNEIWVNDHKMAHLTTNLTIQQLNQKYKDGYNRLIDRFKTYNAIPINGESRR
ncbi:hypothetical protein [Alloprevotella tannerae]|uniref:hypothetical protein n=1 Tax=Alloprevotella tannerae TaxID=76122 RepID=UPI00288C0E26|nr:hypothetical protein [Alloprevotella tannerae]